MRIPNALRKRPWELRMTYHWIEGTELFIEFKGQKWLVHSKWAQQFEVRPSIPKGVECILCIGLGRGIHLSAWANQCKHLIFVDLDLSPSRESIEQLRQIHKGEIHLLESQSPSELWHDVAKVISNCVHLSYVKPIYNEFAKEWVQDVLNFLVPPIAQNSVSFTCAALGLLQGNHFLHTELSKVFTAQNRPIFKFSGDQISASSLWEFELWLKNERPSAVLSVNMKGLDSQGIIASLLKRYRVQLMIWFVDDPRPIWRAFKELDPSLTMVYCWEKAYLSWFKPLNLKRVDYLPLAADSSRFTAIKAKFNSKSAFVGSAMSGAFLNNIVQKAQLHSSLNSVPMLLEQYVRSKGTLDLTALIETLKLDSKKAIWLESFVLHSYTAQKRQRLAERILPLGAEIFGDPEQWKKMFPQWQAQISMDLVYPHETDLVYHSHYFQFNSTSAQMPSAVNQRVFDVPSQGSFLITDAQSDLQTLFEGCEFAVYEDESELLNLWQEFIQDPVRCQKMVEAQRQMIKDRHFYEHRIQQILRDLSE